MSTTPTSSPQTKSTSLEPAAERTNMEPIGSHVEYYGSGANECGYCKKDGENSRGRRSYDMMAYKLTAIDYQHLLDRGWRRSGKYCYHPVNSITCCPNYPISCTATEFKLSRSQRKCIHRMNSFLITDKAAHERVHVNYGTGIDCRDNQSKLAKKAFEDIEASGKARDRRFVKACRRKMEGLNISLSEAINLTREKSRARIQAKFGRTTLEGYLFPKRSNQVNFRNQRDFRPKHQLKIHLRHVQSEASKAVREEELDLIRRYQKAIHNEEEKQWTMPRYCDFLVDSPLIVERMKDLDYLDSKTCNTESSDAHEEDNLNRKVSNPNDYLLLEPPELPTSFGTYHCNYVLDGKLIAVGVLDVLPKCVTTVYFFYDPSYGHLNLGIYSALVEISIVRQISDHYIGLKDSNELIHYHMGFYVHECKKMFYKTKFWPSYLLCSETCQYVPTKICLDKLKDKKYARFSIDPNLTDFCIYQEEPSVDMILHIPIVGPISGCHEVVDYIRWIEANLSSESVDIFVSNFIILYIRLVGKALVPKLTLQVNAVHRALMQFHRRLTPTISPTTVSPTTSRKQSDSTDSPSCNDDQPSETGAKIDNARGAS